MEQKICVELVELGLLLLLNGRIWPHISTAIFLYDTPDLAAGMKLLMEGICIVLLYTYRYDLVLMRLGFTYDEYRMYDRSRK